MYKNFRMSAIGAITFVLLLPVLFAACAFQALRKDIEQFEKSYAIAGKVINSSDRQEGVVVVLYALRDGKPVILQYGFPQKTGHFSFVVGSGLYYLGAFEDLNQNMRPDPEEPAGFYGAPDMITIPDQAFSMAGARTSAILDIRLNTNTNFSDTLDFDAAAVDLDTDHVPVFKLGTLAGLQDSIFDPANGVAGYWQPLSFIRHFGIGIYFMEPYDPKKIPVLFVHGASGTPRSFKDIVSHLDRHRYQAWFYYYPSGMELKFAANGMNDFIEALHEKYRFDRLYITAHSMGGLVSRAAILGDRWEAPPDYIRLFVSISTPWGGVRLADEGVKNAPTAIPSWHDVTPGSPFLRSIFAQNLSRKVPFYLFFSHKGDCSQFMENNDGAVELGSQLAYPAQSDAAEIFGFDESHTSILESTELIERYLDVLDRAEQ